MSAILSERNSDADGADAADVAGIAAGTVDAGDGTDPPSDPKNMKAPVARASAATPPRSARRDPLAAGVTSSLSASRNAARSSPAFRKRADGSNASADRERVQPRPESADRA